MENQYTLLFNEAIRVERNIGSFYALCATHFKDDRTFWWKLSEEEEQHAKILESGLTFLLEENLFPNAIFDLDIEDLKVINGKVEEKIAQFQEKALNKKEVYAYALELEKTSLEFFFQQITSKKSDEKAIKIFNNLIGYDKDHARRIQNLINKAKLN